MKTLNLMDETLEDLLNAFVAFAVEQDKAQNECEHENEEDYARVNAAITNGWQIRDEIKRRGNDSILRLLPLYEHPNVQVRVNAGAATLFLKPVEARHLFESIEYWETFPQKAMAKEMLRALERGHFMVR